MADPFSTPASGAASVLDKDVTITGKITSDGAIRIEGTVNGDVRARTVTLTPTAKIDGNVEADIATVEGRLSGSLTAREVRLTENGRMEGDIIHTVLIIEAGAHFEGECKRKPEGAAKPAQSSQAAAAAPATTPKPASGASANDGAAEKEKKAASA